MGSDYNFILKKSGVSEWTLSSDKGVTLQTFDRCGTPEQAMVEATNWASSWSSVSIRMEDGKWKSFLI